MKNLFLNIAIIILTLFYSKSFSQPENKSMLTIERIMQGPEFTGYLPHDVSWSDDNKFIYFKWNPDSEPLESIYKYDLSKEKIEKVQPLEELEIPTGYDVYNKDRTRKILIRDGVLYLYEIRSGKSIEIINTQDRIRNPVFNKSEDKIIYRQGNNLFSWAIQNGQVKQLTDFQSGNKKSEKDPYPTPHSRFLHNQQLELFDYFKKQKETDEFRNKTEEEKPEIKKPKRIYLGNKNILDIQLSPDEQYITYQLFQPERGSNGTLVPNYVTETGYTEILNARSKVGSPRRNTELFIYHIPSDTLYLLLLDNIPGIKDIPDYKKEFNDSAKVRAEIRDVTVSGPYWSDNGHYAVINIRSMDNKDRWIALLDIKTGEPKLLDRQHDEAWISGPGIGWNYSGGTLGWLPDNQHIYFQSEETGYSHLYILNVETGEKTALTKGQFEVYDPFLSMDKKYWYYTSNQVHPGERHFYRMPILGGKAIRLTQMEGRNDVILSPDEKYLAIRHSFSNKPWELFLQENKVEETARRITNSYNEDFIAYKWRIPEIVYFEAQDGVKIPARLIRPDDAKPNDPAVIFVHGAGYLQNVHKWWSSYDREYMFHNFLADNGYTVLDIDYRGSAGYGHDWRTAIYRHMGGKDLTDQLDGARFLAEKYQVDPENIGIYGGSYGGFITLMAMFTAPDVFAAGAALRPVTDWAHYNHGYTSNILNTPSEDSLAYQNSSPIYYANGLKGALLICHGMVDTNVHFQDVVRLAQKLIELGKENWELAVYPVEGHSFTEPVSWTDEYKRIFRLFETNLKQ